MQFGLAPVRTRPDQRAASTTGRHPDRNPFVHVISSSRPASGYDGATAALAASAAGLRPNDDGAGDVVVAVHDLLDHTWHYRCVVSPTFSAAGLAATLFSSSSGHGGSDPPATRSHTKRNSSSANSASAYNSSTTAAIAIDEKDPSRKWKLKMKDDVNRGHGDESDLLRVRTGSAMPTLPSLQVAERADHVLPLLRLQRERSALTISSLHDGSNHHQQQDGYVSLASLIMNSASSASSPTSESPHNGLAFDLFSFRKQRKIDRTASVFMSTSTTCGEAERRASCSAAHSAADHPSRAYARCLTVD